MIAYILRRTLYAIPILIGVNVLTFVLFFVVNSPDDMARMHLGMKYVKPEAIENWKEERGYNRPLLWNGEAQGLGALTETIFFQKSAQLFVFDFGRSDSGRNIGYDITQRMWPSLAIALPVLLVGLLVNITFAMLIAFFRATYIDLWGVVTCVVLMSISSLFYIIGGQYLVGKLLHLVPISGYAPGLDAFKFVVLPVIVGAIGGIGAGTRWYRTIFLEELGKDYVRTARAKGLSERYVLFRHVLRNALIPILTGVVVVLPLLFMGSLITESFFGIPGLAATPSRPSRARTSPLCVRWCSWARCCISWVCCSQTSPTPSSIPGYGCIDVRNTLDRWAHLLPGGGDHRIRALCAS